MGLELERVETKWLGIWGEWQDREDGVRFLGKGGSLPVDFDGLVVGVAASNIERFTGGEVEAVVTFEDVGGLQHTAGVILGFKSMNDPFFYAEFGDTSGFSISSYVPGLFRPLSRSQSGPLVANIPYKIKATLRGRVVELRLNGVRVAEATIDVDPVGHQVAIIASGRTPISFENIRVNAAKPRAFVATQFAAPFDRVWNLVIRRAAEAEGFDPIRIDEVAGPMPILEDIKRHVSEAAVVIAEVTTANANVFYEVGYADALNKPLVILAQKGTPLPFDIRGYRVVFYEDVIGGDVNLAESLRKQLRAIL
jgi:hypothetical protein